VTGRTKQSTEVAIENWTEVDPENHNTYTNVTKFDVNLKVERDFGTPGALILKNFHRDEFFLKAVSIELPDETTVHFPCNSCVYNVDQYASDRVFFSNKVAFQQSILFEGPRALDHVDEYTFFFQKQVIDDLSSHALKIEMTA